MDGGNASSAHASSAPATSTSMCESLLSSPLAAWWVLEPAIASVSFGFWMNLFRSFEMKEGFQQRLLQRPFRFMRSGFAALAVYWIGVLAWVSVVPPPKGGATGCVSDVASGLQLCLEIASGLVAYDFVFFWLHLAMHLFPRLAWLLGHGRHHEFDGTGDPRCAYRGVACDERRELTRDRRAARLARGCA